MSDDARVPVSLADALQMIGDSDRIHTFRAGGPVLIGADWDRAHIVEAIEKHGVELAGPMATAMHHGLCLWDDKGPLFIEVAR